MNSLHSLRCRRFPQLVVDILIAASLLSATAHVALAQDSSPTEPVPPSVIAEPATAAGMAPFVVGGEQADPGEYPWQVLLRRDGMFVCGGSLIHPRWVLTAAHCVSKVVDQAGNIAYWPAGRFEATMGEHQRSAPGLAEQRRDIEQIIVHPGFRTFTPGNTDLDNDIALLKLSSPVDINEFVQPIALAAEAQALALTAAGRNAVLTGWGSTIPGDKSATADALLEVTVPLADSAACAETMGPLGEVTAKMLCAGYADGGYGGCQGDSGGPLAVRDEANQWWQVGVVNWGSSFCSSDPYGYTVFARVPAFADWIDHIVRSPDGTPPLRNGAFDDDAPAGWVESSTTGRTLAHTEPITVSPSTGAGLAWLGSNLSETSKLRQLVYLSESVQSLRFRFQAQSFEPICGYDKALIKFGGTTIAALDLCTPNDVAVWTSGEIIVSSMAGNTGWLEFVVITDHKNASSLYLDDIALVNSPPAPLTIRAIGPTAAAPGELVSLEGEDFLNVVAVDFGGVPARFSVQSNSSLSAWVPDNVAPGPISVRTAYTEVVSAELFSVLMPLQVAVNGNGNGTVASLDESVNCGFDCDGDYTFGATVGLVALAAPGSAFGGWSGACAGMSVCTVTLNDAREVTATFNTRQGPVILVQGTSVAGRPTQFQALLPMSQVQSCLWTFGDGTSAPCNAGMLDADSDVGNEFGQVEVSAFHSLGQHVFATGGVYPVTLTATNAAGSYAASVQVNVGQQAATPAAVMTVYIPTVLR